MHTLENIKQRFDAQDEALRRAMERLRGADVERLAIAEVDLARLDDACKLHGLVPLPACGRMA